MSNKEILGQIWEDLQKMSAQEKETNWERLEQRRMELDEELRIEQEQSDEQERQRIINSLPPIA